MYEQNENPWNDPQDSQSQQEMYHRNPEPGSAFVFGGLAIIFALLSRGARKKTYGAAHPALLIGTAGVLISVVITIGSFITVSRQYGGFDKFLERYTYTLEQNFGIDLDPGSDNSSTDNGSDGTSIFDNNGSGDYL